MEYQYSKVYEYSKSRSNIGNLRLGDVDSVIFSPPYSESLTKKRKGETYVDNLKHTRQMVGTKDDNIANLSHGNIDSIVTSPPYPHDTTRTKASKYTEESNFRTGHMKEVDYTDENYRSWDKRSDGNIGKRRLHTRVPCSKEEAQFHDTREGRKGTKWEWTKEVEATSEVQNGKSKSKGKTETYLEAMSRVYHGCYCILKPQGLMILVTKNFIRQKKIIPLDQHTIKLCESIGFKLIKRHYRKITNQSFWRKLYRQKYGIEIPYEDVLVFQKG
jgi:tRNA G10  N-methylase Trm11